MEKKQDPKNNKSVYTIVALTPITIQNSLKELRSKFNLPFNGSPTRLILKDTVHFAIKRTFYLKEDVKEEDLIKELKNLNSYEPITITCLVSDFFLNTSYGDILYVKTQENSNLVQLHEEIKQKIDSIVDTKNIEMEGKKYLPHMSLVYNIPKDKTTSVKGYLDNSILPINFSLKTIFLLKTLNVNKDERTIVYEHQLSCD